MNKARGKDKSRIMRRTSRVYLTRTNAGKVEALRLFLLLYLQVINYFIEFFWSNHDFSPSLAEKFITSRAVNRFKISARLSQCASKQAKEIVRSQQDRKIKRMPTLRRKVADLDSRFVTISSYNGEAFELAIKFGSGVPKMIVPLNSTAHLNRLCHGGWKVGESIRLGMNNRGVWIDLILEKEKPELRTEGKVIGIDRGFRKAFVTSDEQEIGADLPDLIKQKDKRSKTSHHHVRSELFRALKQLRLDGVKSVVLEDLRYIKRGTRGKFSRHVNRLLSFWSTARAVEWLRQRCEELGIRVIIVSPYKTSQRCSLCGKIDSKNRKGEKFQCVRCGYEDCADHNAAENLEFLGLAGIYSFRLLQTS